MNSNERKETSKEVFARIEQCCVSACLGLGQSPYNRYLQSITPCREDLEIIKQDLEILELIKKHLYVASGLVEMKITSEKYAKMNKVKFHNGIPIANEEAIDKINKWFWRNFNDEN